MLPSTQRSTLARACAFLLLSGCGARSALESLEPAPTRPPPPANGCPAALQPGAPTPMENYCSTRANFAPARLPTAPEVAVHIPPPTMLARPALEIVVDANGRSYATLATNVNTDEADTLFAFDPDGTVAWSLAVPGKIPQHLFLAADGMLHFKFVFPSPVLAVVDPADGSMVSTSPLPSTQIGGFAIGRDGSLFTELRDSETNQSVVKLAPDGHVLWTSPSFALCSIGMSPIALGDDDLAVVAFAASDDPTCPMASTHARLVALDGSGHVAWTHDFPPGDWDADPAFAPDGSLRFAITEPDTSQPIQLVALGPDGTSRWTTNLQGSPINVWEDPMAIAKDGTAVVHTNSGLVAVSSSGDVLWQSMQSTLGHYDAVVDASGLLAVSDGPTTGIDVATGAVRWTMPQIAPPFSVGSSGSIVGTDAYGKDQLGLFIARNP